MKQQLLLLEDVDALGKKGEIVNARPGYIRNYLLPKGFGVIASPNMLRKQQTLRAEREKQAVVDREESQTLASQIDGITLEIKVKVDPEGHMYGSVSALEVVQLFKDRGLNVERRFIQGLNRPIKETGIHKISLKLKEGIPANCTLHIVPEGVVMTGIEAVTAPIPQENPASPEENA